MFRSYRIAKTAIEWREATAKVRLQAIDTGDTKTIDETTEVLSIIDSILRAEGPAFVMQQRLKKKNRE
ncbi:hypothetical protein KAR91_22910 [Candidatus Pacearchaeota archaeon]|nr:hypothetical protein [Candidatus Pacearchaeota archaeon]